MIELGQTIPAVNLSQLSDKGMQTLTNNELFTDKKLCYLRCLVLYTHLFECSFAWLYRASR